MIINLKKETSFGTPLYCIFHKGNYLYNIHGEEIGFGRKEQAEQFMKDNHNDIKEYLSNKSSK